MIQNGQLNHPHSHHQHHSLLNVQQPIPSVPPSTSPPVVGNSFSVPVHSNNMMMMTGSQENPSPSSSSSPKYAPSSSLPPQFMNQGAANRSSPPYVQINQYNHSNGQRHSRIGSSPPAMMMYNTGNIQSNHQQQQFQHNNNHQQPIMHHNTNGITEGNYHNNFNNPTSNSSYHQPSHPQIFPQSHPYGSGNSSALNHNGVWGNSYPQQTTHQPTPRGSIRGNAIHNPSQSSYFTELRMEFQVLSQQAQKLKDQKTQLRNEVGHLEEVIFKCQEKKSFLEDKEKRLDKLQNNIKQKLKVVQEKLFKLEEQSPRNFEDVKNNSSNTTINNTTNHVNNNPLANEEDKREWTSTTPPLGDEALTDALSQTAQDIPLPPENNNTNIIPDGISEDDNESQNLDDVLEDDMDDDAWSYTSAGSDLSIASRVSLPANISHHMSKGNQHYNSLNQQGRPPSLNRNKHRAYHHHTLDDVVFNTQFRTRSASFNFQQSYGQITPRTYRKKVLKELANSDTPFDLSECTLRGHTKSITAIHLIGSRFVISGSADCTVRVWDLHSKSLIQTLTGHTGWVRSVTSDISDFNAETDEYERLIDDLKFVVSGSGDGTIRLWDVSNPDIEEKCIKVLKGHEGGVTCVKSDTNGVIVSSSVDKTVKVWDRNQSECVQTLIGHERYVKTLQFKSHALITGGGDKCIRLWDLRSGKCTKRINAHDTINVLQFTDDRIIVGCQSGQILDYDLKAGKLLDNLASHGGPISGLKFIGSRLIFSSTVPITSAFHRHHLTNSNNSNDFGLASPRVACKMNGRSFLCLNPIEYNLETKKTTREFFGHVGSVNSLDFSSTKLVTGSTDHTIKSWAL
ncbi:hypothetical protein C9374_000267 [Naegleria lovaniensis]|uniref:Guanine nucleotide-binding protein subunit beta-like protein n=1 Tax=Naegleria lovaniensis TaxID=51637 RepID=A0AA88H058_NAELO|nr:uncharacterized protein C9374_000267 [Naegleria lovaniensis]KAG2388828.1 hypothetical protein C9374_000267 [Naegleria lovaniensis]